MEKANFKGFLKKPIPGGMPETGGGGGLGQFADVGGGLGRKERGGVFERGVDTPCTLWTP